jgi:hypothetical protein
MPTIVENHTSFKTPPTDRGTSVTDAICHVTRALESTNDADDQSIKRPRYLKLTTDQLTQLLMACSTPAAPVTTPDNSPTSVVLVSSKLLAYINNAKYEAICCRPIVPLYDGTEADLMPFLLHLDIRRQDEGWASAISSVTTPATLVYLLNAYWLAFLPIFPGLFLIVYQQNTAMMALTFYGPSRTTSTLITSPSLKLSKKRFILLP